MRDYLTRFVGDKRSKIVHDLHNEKQDCQIEEILKLRLAVPFETFLIAKLQEYTNCIHCIEKLN